MKIERLSENQIRCTLNSEDLASRHLKLSELAYGTTRAKELFQELMQQAAAEYGFNAEDIPLMIEAIPISADCLILLVTKVEDPDELDTRFSRFTAGHDDDADDEDEDENDAGDAETAAPDYADEILNAFTHLNEILSSGKSQVKNPPAAAGTAQAAPAAKESHPAGTTMIFAFRSLEEIIQISIQLASSFQGESSVYKDERKKLYFLILERKDTPADSFHKLCNIITEYAVPVRGSYALKDHLIEMCEPIVPSGALQVLSVLQ